MLLEMATLGFYSVVGVLLYATNTYMLPVSSDDLDLINGRHFRDSPPARPLPFRNTSLPWDERVEDLVGRLNISELTGVMANGKSSTPGIPRLGINPYVWGQECLRGAVRAGRATSFPQALGLGATFSREVLFNVSRATGREVRAKYNTLVSQGNYKEHGISCWSPVINIMRDPRWGRNQETYGEDPYLSGQLAVQFVKGLQGSHERYILTNAGCKHFAVYAGPENIPISRHHFDVQVSERDLRMTFLPQFKQCVDAGTYSLMCSYTSINGVPACANSRLLTDILRTEWGFQGYIVSDEGAIWDAFGNYKLKPTVEETVAASIKAGTNLEIGPSLLLPAMYSRIPEAVKRGYIDVPTLRQSVKPLFYTRMRLGEFDPPSMNPYNKLKEKDIVLSPEHIQLSLQSALRSFVLLKNEGQFLPLQLKEKLKKLAVVGPLADNVRELYGDYTVDPIPELTVTPLDALRQLAATTGYAAGCKASEPVCTEYDSEQVAKAVTGSELIVVCLGTGVAVEAESNDRADIALPGKQLQLLQDAIKYGNGAPVVLLLFNAGPLDISWAQSNHVVRSIIECFYPAQTAGNAVSMLMTYNDTSHPAANPAGRLPATWPAHLEQVPPITNYSMDGRTYRYTNSNVQYPFGYGLSYTKFTYLDLKLDHIVLRHGQNVTINVTLQNTGSMNGEEVIQVYVSWRNSTIPHPRMQLVGFTREMLNKGEIKIISIRVTSEQLSVWDDEKGFVLPLGVIDIYAGGQQPYQKRTVGSNILQQALRLQ